MLIFIVLETETQRKVITLKARDASTFSRVVAKRKTPTLGYRLKTPDLWLW